MRSRKLPLVDENRRARDTATRRSRLAIAEAHEQPDRVAGSGRTDTLLETTVRAVAGRVPLDRLLVETDCPYLTPQAWRGQRNEPAYISATAEALAELKNVPMSDLLTQTSRNAERLFRVTFPR